MAFVEIEDIQTSREVVVFPRTYTAHKNLLAEGNLILVRGKIDAQDGRQIKIIADTITNEFTSYQPVGEPSPQIPLQPAPPVQQPASLLQAQNQTVPYANGTNHKTTAATILAEPPMQYQPAVMKSTPEVVTSRWLHITIPRTGNLTQDKHCLRTVYDLLTQTSGSDRFSFYIPNGGKLTQVDFPNSTTRYTTRLEQQLTQILGAKAVRIE